HVAHDDVRDDDILHHPTTAATCLDSNTAIGAGEDTICNYHIPHVAAHLAPDHHTAVAMRHRAVGDRHIFTRTPEQLRFGFDTGLQGNAVVADINVTVRNVNVATRIWIDPISIRRIRRILDGH